MSGFGTVDGGVPFPESLADMPIIVDLKLPEFGPELMLPHGFEWDAWNPAIVCCDCGIVFSALAPTVDMEQRAYDEMAVEHRRRCPGDGATDPRILSCGHTAVGQPAYERRSIKWWWCDPCASFKRRR